MIPGFYDDNRARSFPFVPGTTGLALGSPFALDQLPFPVLVDAGFYFGARSGFRPGGDGAKLTRVSRSGSTLTFRFAAAALPALEFACPTTAPRYTYLAADSAPPLASDDPSFACAEPAWSGYLVVGDLAPLLAVLADASFAAGAVPVEPGLETSLDQSAVDVVSIANDDHTRATAPDGCPDYVWPLALKATYVSARCAVAPGGLRRLTFRAGYNLDIRQNDAQGEIVFTPRVGAGSGQPCGEIPLTADDGPPTGSSLFSGGPACGELIRSIQGIGGPDVQITGGQGVAVSADAKTATITITIGSAGGSA